MLDPCTLLQDAVSGDRHLSLFLIFEFGLVEVLRSKHPLIDVKRLQRRKRSTQATAHGHQPSQRGLDVAKSRLRHTALALLLFDIVAVSEKAAVLRGWKGPGPFQVERCEGRRGTDPESVGSAVVLVGDEVAPTHDHDVCSSGGVVDEIGCGQYSILQE